MVDMKKIEDLTKSFSDARATLRHPDQELNDEIEALKRKKMRAIRAAVETTAEAHEKLWHALEGAPQLFVKPRSVVIAGIKVGFQKSKGGLEWDDDAQVVALIEKAFPDQAELLIKTTKKPIEAGLKELDPADLERLGVTSVDAEDVPLIKPNDGEISKVVDALMKEAQAEFEEESAA